MSSAALAVIGVVLSSDVTPARADVSPGQGSSTAQALQIAPHDGSLAVGVTLGESLAGHTNGVAKAQSQGIDLGAIGTSLTGYNCGSQSFQPDQIPQPLETETGNPGASTGITQAPDPTAGASQPSYGSTEFVKADSTPYGEADTSFAPVTTPVFSVSGVATKAWSGLVGGARQAGATADVGSLGIAGGLVTLGGLHWESLYPSGGTAQPSGSFTLGSVSVAGVPLPVDQSLTAIQTAVNAVLGTVGLELLLPVSQVQLGVQSVSPLQIQVVPNDTRDNLINLALNATEAQQQTVISGLENGFGPGEPQQLVQALCQTDTPVTVGQVALASINGGGFADIALGGVQSSSSDVAANPFSLGQLGAGGLGASSGTATSSALPVTSPAIAGSLPGTSSAVVSGGAGNLGSGAAPSIGATSPPVGATAGATATPTSAASGATATAQPVSDAAAVHYGAGGPLLGIGLGGLALVGLLAEGDRRMMRRAQHTVDFEE